jgi:uncharacterized caspase-like protein
MRQLLGVLAGLVLIISIGSSARAETRMGLVVGNSAYEATTPLANPLNDAREMTAALKASGFTVIEALDAGKRKLDGALRAFADQLSKADVALFFYAGHGLQVGLENYLVPVDARLERERDLEFEAVKLEFVLRQMEIDRDGKTTIVILDACRDNPLARNLARTMGTRSTAVGRGLAPAPTGLGTFIAYSTQPGNVALDGDGRNSPFTAALVKHMADRGRNLPATMIEVRKDVVGVTGGKQVPWDHSALTGDFYFRPETGSPAPGVVASAPSGSSADLAALQERLRVLEEEAKRRDAAAKAAQPDKVAVVPRVMPKLTQPTEPPSFEEDDGVRIEGVKISDQRQPSAAACREACEIDSNCVAYQHGRRSPVTGLCQLFRRVEARQQDPNWRSGVRTGTALPTEQSMSQEDARRQAALIRVPVSRREGGFDLYDGISVMGQQIKMSTAGSPADCQAICRSTPGCVVAVYNDFFRGKNLACQVFHEISDTMKAPSGTTMVRTR